VPKAESEGDAGEDESDEEEEEDRAHQDLEHPVVEKGRAEGSENVHGYSRA
jgi:hypothetical protein